MQTDVLKTDILICLTSLENSYDAFNKTIIFKFRFSNRNFSNTYSYFTEKTFMTFYVHIPWDAYMRGSRLELLVYLNDNHFKFIDEGGNVFRNFIISDLVYYNRSIMCYRCYRSNDFTINKKQKYINLVRRKNNIEKLYLSLSKYKLENTRR